MAKLPGVPVRKFTKALADNGFKKDRCNSGHEIWERTTTETVVEPIHAKEIKGCIAGVKAEVGLSQDANGSGAYMDFAALLTLKGAKVNGGSLASITFNPYYLEVPVRVGYKYAVNDDFSLFGSVGPYIAVGLFGKAKAKVDGDYFDFDEIGGNSASEDIFGDDGLKRFDFGLGLKAGVEFSKKYQVAISYDFGLVEVIKEVGMKNRNLMISLGYMF